MNKRNFTFIITILLTVFLMSACCGMPKKSLSTVSNVGDVKITANPESAEVYLDGALVGKAKNFDGSPNVLQLESGRHSIEIKADGYNSYSREMMVGAGATETISVILMKK